MKINIFHILSTDKNLFISESSEGYIEIQDNLGNNYNFAFPWVPEWNPSILM